jgi:1,5-anhydro-D-fructose reductase (1,5-anhydro-D-mannitol-forming)
VVTALGWGVVGCGWVARDHVLPGLLATPGARLVGACDRDAAAAERLVDAAAGRPSAVAGAPVRAVVTTDVDALLAAPGLDAVYVATPNHAHAAVVAAVAARGVPVLCEKPLAADVADARTLVAAAGAGLAGTAFDQRFHPAHVRIAELVAAGELGTVTAVRIVYGCWLPPDWSPDGRPHDNWRVDPARAGGGALVDLAPHGIDLVGALLGGDDLERLAVLLQRRVHDYPVDDGAALAGATAGGVLFCAHVAYNTADPLPRRRLEVVGTRAQLVADDTMGQTPGGRLTRVDAATGVATAVPFDTTTSPFTAQLAAFGAAVAGRAPWPWPLERDLRLHELLHDAVDRGAAGGGAARGQDGDRGRDGDRDRRTGPDRGTGHGHGADGGSAGGPGSDVDRSAATRSPVGRPTAARGAIATTRTHGTAATEDVPCP